VAATLAVVLIVMSGMSGTGKSGLATGIGRALGAPVLSVDPIESAIIRAGIAASFETGLAAYLSVEAVADAALSNGLDVVIDAVNSIDAARDMWRALARKHDERLAIIECVISDAAVHAERVARRDRGLALEEPTWADVERRRAEWVRWPEPHLTLDAMDPPDANLATALAHLEALSRA
jgi:predicted kinase